MPFSCPCCDYCGEFERVKGSFWVDSFLTYYRESKRAQRTHVCPQCKTEIVTPGKDFKVKVIKVKVIEKGT